MAAKAPESSPLLTALSPMLAEQVSRPFDDPGWTHEVKYDGYRMLAQVDAGRVTLQTRNGSNATTWFPELLTVLADLPGGRHVLDGEVCVLDDYGRSDFDRLHARAKRRGFPAGADPVVFCAFDLLVHQGLDVRALPLKTRKRRLAQLLRRQRPSVLLVDGIAERGTWLFIQALELKLEGIVSKRLDSEYESGVRSRAWVKVKRPGAVPAERFRRGVGSNR